MTTRGNRPSPVDWLEVLTFAALAAGGGFVGYVGGSWLGRDLSNDHRALLLVLAVCVGGGVFGFLAVRLLARFRRAEAADPDYDDRPRPR